MEPFTIALLGKAGLGLLQSGIGLLGKKPQRPTMQVPGAVNEMVSNTRQLANATQRPGRSLADENIRANSANSIAQSRMATTNGNKLLAAVGRAQGSENNAMRQQDGLDSQFKLNANNQYLNALKSQGAYQQQAWDYNQRQKFEEEAATKSALIGSGIQNMAGAMEDYATNDLLKNMYKTDIAGADTADTAAADTGFQLGLRPKSYNSKYGGLKMPRAMSLFSND